MPHLPRIALCLITWAVSCCPNGDCATGHEKAAPIPLNKIAQVTLQNHFASHPKSLSTLVESYTVPDIYKKSKGLFVTLSKAGKTRACWGSITPQESDLIRATIITCEEALTKEYRYGPIKKKEVPELKCQVTVVEKLEPMRRGATLHPLVEGLMVRSGAKAAVLLPGEASDPYYQVMQCKVKAGITPQEPCQIYRMRAHVYR